MEAESRVEVARCWREEGVGNWYSVGIEFQFRIIKKF